MASTHTLTENSSGSLNIAIGYGSGSSVTTGNFNVDIGDTQSNGVSDDKPGESNTIRIGEVNLPTQTACYFAGVENATVSGSAAVFIYGSGQLGVESSSQRYKQNSSLHNAENGRKRILASAVEPHGQCPREYLQSVDVEKRKIEN